ncbi:hypothetical protein ABZ686_10735 [Streptomyces sp. NPDC006992]|uniref:hypothetical protein n=1 Tax=Streptomyces sp. NPDC006992 TaxID=3155601 RepID=UPI0033E38F01
MTGTPGRPVAARLLPWTSPEGKPCYLIGEGGGRVSRAADDVEDAQLDMAAGLLDHAADMLSDDRATAPQLHYLAARMAESLHQVCRVAESRGARLPAPESMN